MRLRPFLPESDFAAIRHWLPDERAHVLWCAGRFVYPLEEESFACALREFALRYGDRPFLAVTDTGEPVGFFCYAVNTAARTGRLKFVVIDPGQRGKGQGQAMLRLALNAAFREAGTEAVCLSVFTVNAAARKCYERVGFRESRTEEGAFRYGGETWGRCEMIAERA